MSLAASLLALASLLPVPIQDDDPAPGLATLKGRFLLPDGAPAAGVALEVSGWVANQGRLLEFGQPARWANPTGTTDADGRFELRFAPPRAYQFVLSGALEGHGSVSWRWGQVLPGETKDLGDTTLLRTGTIVGRIVDAQGNTLVRNWRVSAEAPGDRLGTGRDSTRVSASVDPETGEFRLEGVPARRVTVRARAGGGVHTDTVTVVVVPAGEAAVELTYDGPNLDRRITVVHFSRPFYTYEPASESITLIDAQGRRRTAVHVQGSSQSEAFDDLPDGEYRVEIDDPLYEPWSKDRVRPGDRVNAHLKGAASLAVKVVHDETGALVQRYGLRVTFPRSNSTPNEFELVPDGGTPPVGGLFEGMIPTDIVLILRLPGRAPERFEVTGLERGEQRAVELRLGAVRPVTVQVVDDTGAPVAETRVERTPGAVAGMPKGMSRMTHEGRVPNLEEAYETAANGRFLTGGLSGTHTFRVRLGKLFQQFVAVSFGAVEMAESSLERCLGCDS